MGAYLSEPVTEKHSNDTSNDLFTCAASSMQGWRASQEDAHNLILDFDKKSSLFAVYDGHGGPEVALYCANNFPDFIRSTNAYKNGDMQQALKDAFLGFDASITERHVVEILKGLSSSKDGSDKEELSSDEDVLSLYQEAKMPLEKLLAKYKSSNVRETSEHSNVDNKSPFLRAKRARKFGESSGSCKSGNTDEDDELVSSSTSLASETKCDIDSSANGHCSTDAERSDSSHTATIVKSEVESETPCSSESSCPMKNEVNGTSSKGDSVENHSAVCSSSTPENGGTSENSKVKGTNTSKGKKMIRLSSSKAKAQQLIRNYAQRLLLASDSDSGDSEDHDETFSGDASSDSGDGSDDESESGDDEDPQDKEFMAGMREEPGSDSGCTAVVAIVQDGILYVANAGDSRCVLCRNGQAIDMSLDHKPEDTVESERIKNAGGRVTNDGRVNGGLNLSRAIGDHAYKQNKDLPPEKQMISAMPDVRQIALTPQDEFLILACDGIWNYLSSQATVDFIKSRRQSDEKLSHVIEKMFDHCLAPDTMGDGTGCDNMTAIIVYFKNPDRLNSKDDTLVVDRLSKKRSLKDENDGNIQEDSSLIKKAKTENCEQLENHGAATDNAENLKTNEVTPVAEVASSINETPVSPKLAILDENFFTVDSSKQVITNNSKQV